MFNEPTGYNDGHLDKKKFPLEITPRPLRAADVDRGYNAAFKNGPDGEPGEAHLVFDQAMPALAAGLRERTQPINEAELRRALLAESSSGDTGMPDTALFDATEDPFENTSIDPESVEVHLLTSIEGLKQELEKTITEVGAALAHGDVNEAATIARGMFVRFEDIGIKNLPQSARDLYAGVKHNLEAAIKADNPEAKSRLYKFACGAADFIPVVGPAKMLAEAASGKTFGGEELTGWKRFLHGAEGLTFLAVDLTGFGAVATKLAKAGKGGLMSAKLLTRTAALMRVLKVPRTTYQPIFRSGAFLLRHPRLAQLATRGMNTVIKGRRLRLTQELPGMIQGDLSESMVTEPTQRDGMILETPPNYELTTA